MNKDQYDPEQGKIVLSEKEIQKRLDKLEAEPYEDLVKQVQAEYQICYDHQFSKKEENLLRLKLYNNQRRDKDAVGDVTMFTTHQTVLASLYIDQLVPDFIGREEGDEEVGETLTQMAEFDSEEMESDITDFDWDWDTLAFGRGLLDMTAFIRDPEKDLFIPAPEVWDPTLALRDPRAVAVNGNNLEMKNAARFYGREIRMSKYAMNRNPYFFKDVDWDEMRYGSSTNSLMERSSQARADAQGYSWLKQHGEDKLGDNAEYDLLEWYTHHYNENGEFVKCKVWMANQRKKIVGYQKLGKAEDRWGLIDRPLYPTSHDWDGTSIWDLTEDKQRHRAVAQNLGMKAMLADVYPMYAYDSNKIKNKNDLKFGFNKFVPVDGDPNSIAPMRKVSPNLPLLDFIYTSLDRSAQIANATPEIQQGMVSSKQRTLGELNIVANKVDTRYSLSAKIFGWSERRKWQRWYWMYKEYFKEDIDKKSIRILGAFGTKWRGLTKENFIGNTDPDVKIESRVLSRAKQLEERQSVASYLALAFQDPTANRRYGMRKLGKLYTFSKDELDRLFPPTIDEMQAEEENDLLNDNKPVPVFATQDHNVHMEMHNKAKDTVAKQHHIDTHKKALMLKVMRPDLFPAPAGQTSSGLNPTSGENAATQQNPSAGTETISPSQTSGQAAVGTPYEQ